MVTLYFRASAIPQKIFTPAGFAGYAHNERKQTALAQTY